MKKIISFFVIATMLLAGSALAYDEAYHVKQAPNGIGDLIIFPGYLAAGTYETKFTVINTDPKYSVVAKVVIRSFYWTEELLDFLIYLSPRDVWTGTLRGNGADVQLYSDDDSILVAPGTFASPGNPVQKNLYKVDCPDKDASFLGYVEVLETWYGDTTQYAHLNTEGYDDTPPHVDKQFLLKLYPIDGSPTDPGLHSEAGGEDWDATNGWWNVTSHGIDHTINALAGFMEINNSAMAGQSTKMRGTVFADFDMIEYLGIGNLSGLDSFTAQNTLGELEAAMAKDSIAMPYLNNNTGWSLHFFNFPTKQSHNPLNLCTYDATGVPGEFWEQYDVEEATTGAVAEQCIKYRSPFWDTKETELAPDPSDLFSGGDPAVTPESSMCAELQYVAPGAFSNLFEEGWIEYSFYRKTAGSDFLTYFDVKRDSGAVEDFTFNGVPVIPFVLNIKMPRSENDKTAGMDLSYGAYDDGEVYASVWNAAGVWPMLTDGYDPANPTAAIATATATGSWLPEYQYWNYMPELGMNVSTVLIGTDTDAYPVSNIGGNWTGTPEVITPPIEFPAQVLLP